MKVPQVKNLKKWNWKKFLSFLEESSSERKTIELTMFKNYYLRLNKYNDHIVIEQQYMFNLKNLRVVSKSIDSVLWQDWWKQIKNDIVVVKLKE